MSPLLYEHFVCYKTNENRAICLYYLLEVHGKLFKIGAQLRQIRQMIMKYSLNVWYTIVSILCTHMVVTVHT